MFRHILHRGAQRSATAFTSTPASENPLVTTFQSKMAEIEGVTDEEREAMTSQAASLVETVVYPAYSRLGAALGNLVPQAGRDAGVWRLGPEGEAFYQHALNSYGASV